MDEACVETVEGADRGLKALRYWVLRVAVCSCFELSSLKEYEQIMLGRENSWKFGSFYKI
jgi:hypothetical protein